MVSILGISAFYHDSAAALVVDGDIVAAAQEERFTRRKHDAAFPANAILGISTAELPRNTPCCANATLIASRCCPPAASSFRTIVRPTD